MISSTLLIESICLKEPTYDPAVFEAIIPPLQKVQYFSPDDYEDFIGEWAISCAKPIYKDVYRIGAAGDMGRDVIGEYADGTFDYYQCKRYGKKLAPSMFWIELGKLCFYSFNGDISVPKKYYIIAAQNIGPKMRGLLNDKEMLKKSLLEQWGDKCCKNIIEGKDIVLTTELLEYISAFDFGIIDTYSMGRIIEEYRKTEYFYFRFGGSIKPKRGLNLIPPDAPAENEFRYIDQLLFAYSDNRELSITMSELISDLILFEDFKENRSNFYCAESLKRFIRDIFTNENHFNILKKEMHSGISDFLKGKFTDGYDRLIKTMHESTKVNLSASIIDSDLHFVTNQDKKGLCHHLVNDNKINWVNK